MDRSVTNTLDLVELCRAGCIFCFWKIETLLKATSGSLSTCCSHLLVILNVILKATFNTFRLQQSSCDPRSHMLLFYAVILLEALNEAELFILIIPLHKSSEKSQSPMNNTVDSHHHMIRLFTICQDTRPSLKSRHGVRRNSFQILILITMCRMASAHKPRSHQFRNMLSTGHKIRTPPRSLSPRRYSPWHLR